MSPIYTAFFTVGTLYEREADRLRASLEAQGLQHDIRGVADRGSWELNAGMTAAHIAVMQAAYPRRPIVQLDADAIVQRQPVLFDTLPETRCDIAVHYRRGTEMLNGTIYLAPTEPARQVIRLYQEMVAAQKPRNEQLMLQNAIAEMSELLRVCRLPAGYCFIPDIMKDDLEPGEEITIAHMQASRERGSGPHVDRRRSWIREWEKVL